MDRRNLTRTLLASTVGAALIPRSGNAQTCNAPCYAQTPAEIAVGVAPTDTTYPPGDVRRYGAVGNGGNDTAAIQRAVHVAAWAGGIVYFPTNGGSKYGIASEITISSRYPVHLISEMTTCANDVSKASYIKPLGNIAGALFKYQSPTSNPADGGAGTIRGLSFLDDSALAAPLIEGRRNFTITAALDLDGFANGRIEDCSFTYLRGSAMLFGFCVLGHYSGIIQRYCGDVGKAALQMRDSGSYQTQGCTFVALKSEVNFLAPHIAFASNSNDNKFVAPTFESTETNDEVSSYMILRGLRNTVTTPTFNRRPAGGYAVEFATSASRCTIVAPVFDLGAGKAILFSADRNEVIGGHVVADRSTAAPVVFAGVRNRLENVHFYAAPGFQINAPVNAVEGCTFDSMLGSSGYCVSTTANAPQAKVTGNRIVGLPSGLGGISFGSDGICSNNALSGGGGASIGINVQSANVVCVGNYIANFGTALVPNGHLSDSVIANNVGYP